MKILAVDFGLNKIGFAIGNALLDTATPIEPVKRKNSKLAIEYIKSLIDEYDINRVVIGYPLHMDNTATYITREVDHFTRRLKKAIEPDINIDWVDERLSSFEAKEELKSIPLQKKHKDIIDSMSAVIILRRFMTIQKSGKNGATHR